MHSFLRWSWRPLVVAVSAIVISGVFAADVSAAPGSFLVTPALAQSVGQPGEVFKTVTITDIEPVGRDTVLSATPDGLTPMSVDDALDVQVTHQDGSVATYSHDFSNGCSGSIQPLLVDLTPLVATGKNTIQLTLRDICGDSEGNSDIWAVGGGVFSAGGDRAINSPDIKIIRFLQVPIPTCAQQLLPLATKGSPSTALQKTTLACGFLVGASNPNPPVNLSGDAWTKFVASEEFRGFIHLPSYRVSCSNNQITSIDPDPGAIGVSPGWTPTILPVPFKPARVVYEKAEWYSQADFHPTTPQFRYSSDNSPVLISLREASRIATASRAGQFGILSYDAPFIWAALHVKVTCAGTVEAVVAHSTIPRVAAYVTDNQVLATSQSGDLRNFVISGGTTFHLPGQGNLDPYCTIDSVVQVGVVHTVPSLPCTQAADNGGLLS